MVRQQWCGDGDGGVESRVRESDGGDRTDRVMGRIFGVGRKSSPENFSGGCGGGRRRVGRERVMKVMSSTIDMHLSGGQRVNTPGSDENSLKLYDLIADMKGC
ncbi:hypothetical protein Tco_0299126 [Tanacetum coccineum]